MSTDDVDVDVGGGQSAFMNQFFQEVGSIKANMGQIQKNIDLISQKHREALAAVTSAQGNANSEALERLVGETNQVASTVRTQLKRMDLDNKNKTADATQSEVTIRKNMHSTLTRKFVEIMSEYQEVQTKYKNDYRERVARQVKIVKPDATASDVQEALEGNADSIFRTEFVQHGPKHNEAKNALLDIQEKNRDIRYLEQSIAELASIFQDMSQLVHLYARRTRCTISAPI